jgi:hypothetical protein
MESIPPAYFCLAGQYDNPIPTRFSAPIDCSIKFQHSTFCIEDIEIFDLHCQLKSAKISSIFYSGPFYNVKLGKFRKKMMMMGTIYSISSAALLKILGIKTVLM